MKTTTRKPGRPRDLELSRRRREEILSVATKVFADRGYPSTDVQTVADVLEVGKGTVYRYFKSKRELFLAAADRGMRQLRTYVDNAAAQADDSLDRVRRGICAYLTFFDKHPELVELLIQERAEFKNRQKPTYFVHRDANIGEWRDLFRDLIREDRVRDIPPARITDVLSDLVYGTMFTNFFAGRRKSSRRQAQDIIDVVFLGILSEAERVMNDNE